ncbi:hypothetical protein [Fundidesulfovibrio terrae]|uniref:hypothetical protein n=1 Tax=Fundidesulfovibrio terrae TaxID=2922866 RepID=UPI001FAED51C|nr:hypothetical protein [Fundidesulfovibrio terrae]
MLLIPAAIKGNFRACGQAPGRARAGRQWWACEAPAMRGASPLRLMQARIRVIPS